MSTITIIEGNNNDKDNTRAIMVKGETGATITKIEKTGTQGKVDTYTITLSDGRTQTFEVTNGVTPTATVTKLNSVATITITDENGTTTANVADGAPGFEVPAGSLVGWDSKQLSYTCDGTEAGNYYLTNNSTNYYFAMPTVSDGDVLIFDKIDLELSLDGTTIPTTTTGTGTELTFVDVIPTGYEDTGEAFIGAVPTGVIMEFAGATAPNGFLICDGSAVSRTTYMALFSIIGTLYGTGDGTTTFNLPDLRGKVAVGYNSTETEFDTLGETGGEKTHTLTVDEIPSHTHRFHAKLVNAGSGSDGAGLKQGTDSRPEETISNTGGGLAHNNLQPYITLNYIIKY